MSIKPPVGPNTPLGTGRVFYNVVADGGARGNGTSDDTVAVRRTYAAANATGGIVIWPSGSTYKISNGDSGGSIAVASNVTSIMYGAEIDISGAPSSYVLFAATGTVGTHYPLSANTTVGAASVSVAAGVEANFAADNYVLLGSEGYYEQRTLLYGAATGQKTGEIGRIASTSSGSLTFHNRLAAGYVNTAGTTVLNYTTANTAFAAVIAPVENVHFRGGYIKGISGSGTSSTQSAIQITFGVACSIEDTRAKNIAYLGFGFLSCVECHMDNVGGSHFWNTNNGYCVAFGDATQDCTATNIRASKCRHAFTTISIGNSYGVVRRCEVNGKCWHTHSTGDAWDSHAAAEDITYRDCDSYSSAGQGLNFEGSRCTVIGGTHRYSVSHGVSVHNETLMPAQVKVVAPRVIRPGIGGATAHGVVFSAPVTAGANTEIWALELDGEVHHPTGIGIYATGSASIQYDGARISGTVNYSQSASGAFFSQYIDRVKMHGCEAKNVINASSGCRQDNGTLGTMTGCTAFGVAASTGSAFLVKNGSHTTLTGNTAGSISKGVNLDNTSSNCTVFGNDLDGATTPVSPGNGAGHHIGFNMGYVPSATTYSPGASPDLYTNATGYPVRAIVSGGTLSLIKISTDGGSTKYTTGVTAGAFVLGPNDSLEITYTVAPSVFKIVPLMP